MSKTFTEAKWTRIHVMRETLARLFPATFMAKGIEYKRPLKIGIYDDLVAASRIWPFDPADLRATVNVYCNSARYLAALVEGAERVDLQGNVVGTVNAEAAARAARQLQLLQASKQLRAEVKAKEVENAMLKAAIQTARGCFAAATIEGLFEAIAETTDERLRDLLERRLLHADVALSATGLEATHG